MARPSSGRLLTKPPRCASVILTVLLVAGFSIARAQQPMNPTPQAPPSPTSTPSTQMPGSSNPNQKKKEESTVPPGSVLPSYNEVQSQPSQVAQPVPTSQSLRGWTGLNVIDIRYAGVSRADLDPLPGQLDQQPNTPLEIGRAHV